MQYRLLRSYGNLMSQGSEYYLSLLMPAVVIGNALAVIAAGVLNSVGKKFPSTTGNGVLMKGFTFRKKPLIKSRLPLRPWAAVLLSPDVIS